MRVFRLEALTDEEVGAVVRRALTDEERGLAGALGPKGGVGLPTTPASTSSRSRRRRARRAQRARGRGGAGRVEDIRDADGSRQPALEDIETAAQQRILAYDRAGDGHYGTVSAFIKSMRGNDVDASLYWLATMIAAGEDPQVRRAADRHQRLRGRRQRGSAGAAGGGGGRPGARLRRPARGAVRAGAGDGLRAVVAQVGLGRPGVRCGDGGRASATARCRCRTTFGRRATGG